MRSGAVPSRVDLREGGLPDGATRMAMRGADKNGDTRGVKIRAADVDIIVEGQTGQSSTK